MKSNSIKYFILLFIFMKLELSLNANYLISFKDNPYNIIEMLKKKLKNTKNPKVGYASILFHYYDLHAKSIYLKSDFDNWYFRYPFKKVIENNIWKGFWKLDLNFKEKSFQLKKGTYHYKLIIDGAFIYDKYNPLKKYDQFRHYISYFHINEDLIYFNQLEVNPIKSSQDPNLFRFIYKGTQEDQVYLLGNFNDWNSYSHPMIYKGNGIWELIIRLPRGEYYYQFFVDDEFRKDILNPLKSHKYPNFSYFKVE